MPEPTVDPRARQLAEERLRIAHEPHGTTARLDRLMPDEQQLCIDEAGLWLRAAIAAGIVPAAAEQPAAEACGKCKRPFDPTDKAFDGRARYFLTAFCRGCVDHCESTEIADHRCVICA